MSHVSRALDPPGPAESGLRGLYAVTGVVGSAFIPFYVLLLRSRGLSASEIGLVLAVTSLTGVAASPVWSHAADTRLGTVHTLQVAFVATAAAALALMATGSALLAIVAVAGVLGVAQSPSTALTDTLTLSRLGPQGIERYGVFRLWASVGWGAGSIAFGALFGTAGLTPMLPIFAAGVVASAIYVDRFPRVRPERVAGPGSRLGSAGEALRHVPHLAPFLTGVLLVGTSTHAAWDFVPLRIVSGGGGPFLVGLAAGVSAFVEIPFMLMYVSLVVMTGRLVPERLRNTGQALMQICTMGLAPVLGGALGGLVYEYVGPARLFAGSAVGIALGIGVVWRATSGIDAHLARGPVSG